MSKLETNTIDNISGSSTLTIGDSNTSTIALKSGATLTNFPTNEAEFSVTLGSSSTTNIANNTSTIIPFTNEEFDPDGVFNTSTYKFTAPSAGKYFFSWLLRKNDFSSTRFFVDMFKNDSEVGTFETGNGSSDFGSITGNILLNLAQNDTVHGKVTHNQGGTQALSNPSCRFFGFKLIG